MTSFVQTRQRATDSTDGSGDADFRGRCRPGPDTWVGANTAGSELPFWYSSSRSGLQADRLVPETGDMGGDNGDPCLQVAFKKIESAFRTTCRVKISGRFVTVELLRFLRQLGSSERRFDSLSSIGTFKEPSYPSPAVHSEAPHHCSAGEVAKKETPSSKAQNRDGAHVLDPAAQSFYS